MYFSLNRESLSHFLLNIFAKTKKSDTFALWSFTHFCINLLFYVIFYNFDQNNVGHLPCEEKVEKPFPFNKKEVFLLAANSSSKKRFSSWKQTVLPKEVSFWQQQPFQNGGLPFGSNSPSKTEVFLLTPNSSFKCGIPFGRNQLYKVEIFFDKQDFGCCQFFHLAYPFICCNLKFVTD